jgi:23S rRNA pseudouridine1911/1915/1917 synthase
MRHELTVPAGAAAERLDVFLAAALGESRSQVQRWLKAGQVQVNGSVARASYEPVAGDQVVVEPAIAAVAPAAAPELPIVYEDADLLVIDKPAGLAVHGGNGRAGEPTVAEALRGRTTDPDPDRPGIVHRLDRDTSGLLVVAKSAAAKAQLQAQWRERQVAKTYLALVVGRLQSAEAVINLPLDRDPAHPTRRHVSPGGRPAITHYRTLAEYPGYTYVEARPETGRTHQLRVHFAALGHPIAGDVVYGPPKRPVGLMRQFLHATALSLVAPNGRRLELHSPLPADLSTVLSRLEGPYN